MKNKIENFIKKPVVLYSIIFCIITFGVFYDFILGDKLYIFTDIGSDTYVSFLGVYKYVIDAIKEGTFTLWSFNLGLGASIFSLAIFIFDPFNIILLMLPTDLIPQGLLIAAILKMYLMGIVFYYYLKEFKVSDNISVLGAIIWAFNGFVMLWGQHYMFGTTIMLFTATILGLELFIKKERKIIFTISLTLILMNSAYMGYTVTIFVFLYAFVRYLYLFRVNIKEFFKYIFKIIKLYLTSIALSAIVFLPNCYLILASPRVSGIDRELPALLADNHTIFSTITRLFSNNLMGVNNYFGNLNYYESIILCTSILILMLIPQMFKFIKGRKEKIILITSIVICIFSIFSPFIAYIFNGFSIVGYRWSFVIMFPAVVVGIITLDNIIKSKKLNIVALRVTVLGIISLITLGVFGVLKTTYLTPGENDFKYIIIQYFLILLLIVITYLLLSKYNKTNKKIYIILLFSLVCIEQIVNNYPTVNNRITLDKGYQYSEEGYYDGTSEALEVIKNQDDSFYRVAKEYWSVYLNDQYFQDYYGLESYISLNSTGYIKFSEQFDNMIAGNPNWIGDIRSDRLLRNFLGVKYVLDKNNKLSDEYAYITTVDDIKIYENKEAFPLGFTYDNYILKDDFQKLPLAEKEELMLENVVLNEDVDYISKYYAEKEKLIDREELDYTLSYSELNLQDDSEKGNLTYIPSSNMPKIDLSLKESSEETLVLDFEIKTDKPIIAQVLYSNNGEFYADNNFSFIIIPKNEKYSIPIDFKNLKDIRVCIGSYNDNIEIKNLKLYSREDLETSILKDREVFNVTSFKEDNIKGNIAVDNKKILTWTIPYCKGWKVYVDGKSVDTLNVNSGLLGIEIEKGNHNIEVKYIPPTFILGVVITFSTTILLVLNYKFKNRKKSVIKNK